jgi:hypothetical protein
MAVRYHRWQIGAMGGNYGGSWHFLLWHVWRFGAGSVALLGFHPHNSTFLADLVGQYLRTITKINGKARLCVA